MNFNPDKCKIMHIGHKFDMAYKRTIKGNIWKLNDTKGERDLRITVTNNLKPSLLCSNAATKARLNKCITRNFGSVNKEEFKIEVV